MRIRTAGILELADNSSRMPSNGASLTLSIRIKLQEGATPDDVVRDLVARGMREDAARRFVDRAVAENAHAGSAAS